MEIFTHGSKPLMIIIALLLLIWCTSDEDDGKQLYARDTLHSFEHLPEVDISIELGEKPVVMLRTAAPSYDDPLWPKQWHLFNRKIPGHDVNVVPVWEQGISGKGVVVCIIDDGIDYSHVDLKGKFVKNKTTHF